jgi:hypothetical protein
MNEQLKEHFSHNSKLATFLLLCKTMILNVEPPSYGKNICMVAVYHECIHGDVDLEKLRQIKRCTDN